MSSTEREKLMKEWDRCLRQDPVYQRLVWSYYRLQSPEIDKKVVWEEIRQRRLMYKQSDNPSELLEQEEDEIDDYMRSPLAIEED